LLYSHSRGEATDDEPMHGQTAWDPTFNHEYIASSKSAEKLLLQRKLLYDAWRYLMAKEPAQIATIKKQLQGSHRQNMLLKELDKARRARTNLIKQKTSGRLKEHDCRTRTSLQSPLRILTSLTKTLGSTTMMRTTMTTAKTEGACHLQTTLHLDDHQGHIALHSQA
jgi:hypothetical protein